MNILKSFGMLAQVLSNPVEKTDSSKGLNKGSKLPDCQYYKSRMKCNQTKFLVEMEGGVGFERIVKVTEDKFLFPNEIRKKAEEMGGILRVFQWFSPKIKSPLYTGIKSRRKLYTTKSIVLSAQIGEGKQQFANFLSCEEAQKILDLDGIVEFEIICRRSVGEKVENSQTLCV